MLENTKVNAKEEWLNKKLRNGFLILNKNQFPKLTNTSYDPLLFEAINSAYILKNRQNDFFKILETAIVFDGKKNDYCIESSNLNFFKDAILRDKVFDGLKVFELNPKGSAHLGLLEELGAEIPEQSKSNLTPISGKDAIKLNNYNGYINKKYDITFSNELMDENSGIKYDGHSSVFSAFELYSVYANITKKNGFSIHSNGSVISSLYETFFQFIGFKVVDYFRNSDGSFDFTMIMKKINEKQVAYDEFFYVYSELKKRWPTRYGN